MSSAAAAQFAAQAKQREKAAAEAGLKDIWTTLIEEKEQARSAAAEDANREATIIYVGARGSGKTTLMNAYMFKERDEATKPTTCLEYKHVRTAPRDNLSEEKSVSHFWELGGGRSLVNLLSVPLSAESIRDSLVILTLDFSRTSKLVDDATFWLGVIKRKCDEVMATLKQRNRFAAEAIVATARRRFGEQHADITRVDLLPIPVLICVHKYDAVKSLEPEQLRVLSRALRAIAHQHGCSLMYTSRAHRDTLLKAYRSRISDHLMNKFDKKQPPPAFDHAQHITVASGQDSFAQIGDAPGGSGKSPAAAWSSVFAKTFDSRVEDQEEGANVEQIELEPEKTIDASLAQREEDLTRLKRELDLRRKLNAQEDGPTSAAGTNSNASTSAAPSRLR